MSFPIDLKINYKEIAAEIEKTGGWGEVNGRASFFGHDAGVHRFHIFPETVESFIESAGKDDFAIGSLRRPFRLEDYPTVAVQAFNVKTAIQQTMDIASLLIGLVGGPGGEPSKGATGANDSTKSTSSSSISQEVTDFVKSLPEKVLNGLQAMYSAFQRYASNLPDLYYRKIPQLFSMTIPGASDNNSYTLPLMNLDKMVSVDGNFGWSSDNGYINKLIKFARGYITTGIQPFFSPSGGMGEDYPSIQVRFPLFNDTLEHAEDNYKFIHTILPWNMWVQWGLTTIPGVLYRVAVDGGLTYVACTCSMSLSYQGTMREVDPAWTDAMGEIVTVPDVYVLTCTFTSLLNSNFNHYLMSYESVVDSKNDITVLSQIGEKVKGYAERSKEKARREDPLKNASDYISGPNTANMA